MISDKIKSGINGEINIPGDKSISHRAIIIPSISNGVCEISNILKSEDVLHTINAFRSMGVNIEEKKDKTIVYGRGLNSLKKPKNEIYLGNSGTSARLLTGLLSSQSFDTIIKGDKSLSSRPMERITKPLSEMGAKIITKNGKLPLHIKGKVLNNCKINIDNVKKVIAGIDFTIGSFNLICIKIAKNIKTDKRLTKIKDLNTGQYLLTSEEHKKGVLLTTGELGGKEHSAQLRAMLLST